MGVLDEDEERRALAYGGEQRVDALRHASGGLGWDRLLTTTGQQHEVGVRYQPPGVNALFTAAAFDLRRQNVLTTDPQDIRYQVQTGEIRARGAPRQPRSSG